MRITQQIQVAERVDSDIDVFGGMELGSGRIEIFEPGASFIKLHFAHFDLPRGASVIVSSPDGMESWRYAAIRRDPFTLDSAEGDDGRQSFSAMSVTGDTAVLEVRGLMASSRSLRQRVLIDYYLAGFPEAGASGAPTPAVASKGTGSGLQAGADPALTASPGGDLSHPEAICGADQRFAAACYESSRPAEFDRSWPVARLITSAGASCTAWRVGSDNRLLTNHHCIHDQAELAGAEVWFNYQYQTCSATSLETTVKVAAADLLATDPVLDFSLFSVQDFSQVAVFGNLGLEVRDAALNERIYIPQHGSGFPKQIALEDDMNPSGLCRVDAGTVDGNAPGTDIGYYCDTRSGSSGSPVVAAGSHRAIALHHFGSCANSGVKMSLIWPKIAAFFGGVVPAGNGQTTSTPPPAAAIVLQARAIKARSGKQAELTWSGAAGSAVVIYRQGSLLTSTPNDGRHLDTTVGKRDRSARYRLCETGSGGACSAEVTVTF